MKVQSPRYNPRVLKDDQQLQFYNIEKDCNLRLNFQTWEHSTGPKKETSQDLSLSWDQIASRAKTELEEELEEKKPLYTNLMDERSKIQKDARKLKDDLKQDEFSIMSVCEQVLEKDEIIKQQEEVIKTITSKIKTEKIAKEDLEEVLETTKGHVIEKRKQVASNENTIKKLDDEMKELSIVNNKR
jgi:chromosome segregation ATPase